VALSQGSAITLEHSDRLDEETLETKLAKLEQVQDRVLNYRLAHRFTLAGFGANQNLVHKAWRQAMHIEELERDVTNDVAQATTYLAAARKHLQAQVERENQKQLVRNASWFKAAIAFLGAIEGVRAVTAIWSTLNRMPTPEMEAVERFSNALGLKLGGLPAAGWIDIAIAAAPLVVAGILGLGVWLHSRKVDTDF